MKSMHHTIFLYISQIDFFIIEANVFHEMSVNISYIARKSYQCRTNSVIIIEFKEAI